jgi:hypothetical protein
MALLTVPGGEARIMVGPQPMTACCTRRARGRDNTPRGDPATAGYAGPPAGQGKLFPTMSTVPRENINHHQPINVPTAEAKAFLMDYT